MIKERKIEIRIKKHLRVYATQKRASASLWFFKTGPGQYGEGDQFLGIAVPDIRKVVNQYKKEISISLAQNFIKSIWHEERLFGLLVFIELYDRIKSKSEKRKIYQKYLKLTKYINNWDLVDTSASRIVGNYCFNYGNTKKIISLSQSKNQWERRISMISSLYYIKYNQLDLTYLLAERVIEQGEKEDLMHKATGWMLREAGKKNPDRLIRFIRKYVENIPRTMLRYSIEKFTKKERNDILKWG